MLFEVIVQSVLDIVIDIITVLNINAPDFRVKHFQLHIYFLVFMNIYILFVLQAIIRKYQFSVCAYLGYAVCLRPMCVDNFFFFFYLAHLLLKPVPCLSLSMNFFFFRALDLDQSYPSGYCFHCLGVTLPLIEAFSINSQIFAFCTNIFKD